MIPFSSFIAPVVHSASNIFFSYYDEKLFNTLTPKEMLTGYKFPLMEMLDRFFIKPIEWLGIPLPIDERLPENKMGIFNIVNDTNRRGPYTMYTGVGKQMPFTYKSYKGKP